MLTDEIERVSSKGLDFVKIYATSKLEALHRTWIAFFSNIHRGGSRVFDESGVAKIFKKKHLIGFRKRSNGHHNIKTCSRAPSCGNCGSTMHAQEACL
ncbi:putative eka-like protein [Erysiphe necator]|uniref:Putative eka-like protein n=1 Tax=Uncinula necator TaxID=52586 RepID=A0A0B1PED9_UNCNE|nr:putative eka-like protein [Erysiphe necator]